MTIPNHLQALLSEYRPGEIRSARDVYLATDAELMAFLRKRDPQEAERVRNELIVDVLLHLDDEPDVR